MSSMTESYAERKEVWPDASPRRHGRSTFPAISEIHTKTARRCRLTPVRTAVIRKRRDVKLRMRGTASPGAPSERMQTGAASVGSSMEVPRKVKPESPYDPAVPRIQKTNETST